MTSYTPIGTKVPGNTLAAAEVNRLDVAVASLAGESTAQVPTSRLGSGTPGAGTYVDGASGAWTDLPAGGGDDPAAVKLTGDQTVAGVKTFTAAPVVPDGSFTIGKTSGLQTALDGKVPTTRTITAGAGLTGGGDLTANRSLAVTYGTTAGTAAQGNDTRLSDARTPTSHAASHASGGADALTISGAQITSGVIPPPRLGTGTADATTVLYGDGTWKTAPAGGGGSPTYETVPAGSTFTIDRSGGAWPARPTTRTDVIIRWRGTAPAPSLVTSGTAGMYATDEFVEEVD